MGFTRSTTTTNVHSTLGDYPSVDDGLTPEQLKARFDSPATGLKGDINNLEEELEATTSASYLGADKITASDDSADNIQAKLNKIYLDLQEVAAGEVPDNSITQAKIASDYDATLAKKTGTTQTNLNADLLDGYHASSFALKNGNVQTNLNAEKLGGTTLAQLIGRVSSYFTTGTVVISNGGANTINLGFTPSLVVLARQGVGQGSGRGGDTAPGIAVLFSNQLTWYGGYNSEYHWHSAEVTPTSTTVTLPYAWYGDTGLIAGTYNYIAFKSSI